MRHRRAMAVAAQLLPLLAALVVGTPLAAQRAGGDSGAQVVASPAAPRVLTIGEARARRPSELDTFTVAGRAAVAAGVFQVRALEIVIASPSGGLRVYTRAPHDSVAEGDSVVATGILRAYRGDIEVVASSVRVVPAPRRLVQPALIRVAPRDAAAHAGQLVQLVGRIAARGANDGGQWIRLGPAHRGDSATIDVWVSASTVTGIDLHQYEPGELLAVTGFIVSFQDSPGDPLVWQIAPRSPADLQVRGIPRRWYRYGAAGILGLVLLVGGVLVGLKVNARRNAARAAETEERYRQLLQLLPDAVLVYGDDGILFTNPAAARLLEVHDERALVGQPIARFLDGGSRDLAKQAPGATPADDAGVARVRGVLVGARGGRVDVEVTTGPCRYHDRPAMVMLARDIGDQLRHERDLHALALRDDLTGLHNRRGFTLLAEQELVRARRYGRSALLLFADLNGLKGINDEFGHAAGDEALRLMARALRSVVRESDVVARWGGDEFVALVFESEAQGAETIAARLNDALRRLAGDTLAFVATASVGMTPLDPQNVPTIAAAIGRADSDLYRRRQQARKA